MNKPYTHVLFRIFLALFLVTASVQKAEAGFFGAAAKNIGTLYLAFTSPVELICSERMIEEQHIVPQMFGTGSQDTVLITKTNHTISDRWRERKHLTDTHENLLISLLTLGNDSSLETLNAGYRLGCYMFPYAIFRYGYRRGSASLLCTYFDAPSMLVYGYAWAINIPQKLIQKTAYIVQEGTKPNLFYLLDLIPNALMLFVEAPLALLGTTAGTVIAFVWNPIDSFCSFFGMFYFAVMATFTAIWQSLVGLFILLPFV